MDKLNTQFSSSDTRTDRVSHIVTQRLCYPGLNHSVILENADAVQEAIRTVTGDWAPQTIVVNNATEQSKITTTHSVIKPAKTGYKFKSWWARSSMSGLGVAGATCGAIADLCQAFCDERAGSIALHCGAFEINGRLIALTGPYRTGKSTLISRLTCEKGVTVFCDDVLPILEDNLAYGLGIAPRLRLPLPDSVSKFFRTHVETCMGPRDKRYGFLLAPNLAPHGTRAPLSAIIALSRVENAPAKLHQMETAEAVRHLIRQNIADPGNALCHIDRMTEMANDLLCLKLVYSDLEDAVDLIRQAFGAGDFPSAKIALAPPISSDPVGKKHPPADLKQVFLRCSGVAPKAVGQDLFLWQPAERNFFQLDPIANAVWSLLETAQTGDALAEILGSAFPDTPTTTIREDLANLLAALLADTLIAQLGADEISQSDVS